MMIGQYMPGAIPKPVMRRLHITNAKRDLVEMTIFTFIGVMLFKTFYVDRRKKLFEDFYKTYDGEAALQRMNDAGLMQSCPKK